MDDTHLASSRGPKFGDNPQPPPTKKLRQAFAQKESQSVAGHPPLAVIAVKVAAAAAGEGSLEVHGVRLGDSVRQEGAKGRYGDRGCLGGPLFPSLAGCREHGGPHQDRGCKRAFRAPPTRRCTRHRSGSCFHRGAPNAPPKQAAVQTSRGGCSHPRAPGSFGGAAPPGGRELVKRREQEEEEEDAVCCRGSPELRPGLQRLKFLLSRCLLSARQLVGFPHSPSPEFPPFPARLRNL
ncbi:hypothetical protein NN561_014027 [Cricetulus griseus]